MTVASIMIFIKSILINNKYFSCPLPLSLSFLLCISALGSFKNSIISYCQHSFCPRLASGVLSKVTAYNMILLLFKFFLVSQRKITQAHLALGPRPKFVTSPCLIFLYLYNIIINSIIPLQIFTNQREAGIKITITLGATTKFYKFSHSISYIPCRQDN